ncbi:hypothetical protein AGMMS49921_11680 [Endomicrobiia bacterium]|nr:hypothetical protein AGMMS49921_11680 [Endomicrobiia bacterium]
MLSSLGYQRKYLLKSSKNCIIIHIKKTIEYKVVTNKMTACQYLINRSLKVISVIMVFGLVLSSCKKENAFLVNRRTATQEKVDEVKKRKEAEEEAKRNLRNETWRQERRRNRLAEGEQGVKEEDERIRQVRAERRRQDTEAIRLMQEEMAERIKQEKEDAENKFFNDHLANLAANFNTINSIPLTEYLPNNSDSDNDFDDYIT